MSMKTFFSTFFKQRKTEKPTTASTREDVIAYLNENEIEYDNSAPRSQLLLVIEFNRFNNKK